MKGKEGKGDERKGKEGKGKERKGEERKGKERKRKERRGREGKGEGGGEVMCRRVQTSHPYVKHGTIYTGPKLNDPCDTSSTNRPRFPEIMRVHEDNQRRGRWHDHTIIDDNSVVWMQVRDLRQGETERVNKTVC
jgi:hypothetical protein